MTQEQWFDLDSSFSFRFAMDNSPEGISEELISVMDMEVRAGARNVAICSYGKPGHAPCCCVIPFRFSIATLATGGHSPPILGFYGAPVRCKRHM